MPRNVRNAWIDARIDNGATFREIKGGPKAKNGGLSADFSIRERGAVAHALKVTMEPTADGARVILRVFDRNGNPVHVLEVER